MRRRSTEAPRPTVRLVRCAIYTRKSSEEGLEQEFNSLDAQREAGESYIRSLQHEGWSFLPERYDDGGFTGGNMERPGVQRLLADIEAGKIDCVVVYKVDRLSRSVLYKNDVHRCPHRCHRLPFAQQSDHALSCRPLLGRFVAILSTQNL